MLLWAVAGHLQKESRIGKGFFSEDFLLGQGALKVMAVIAREQGAGLFSRWVV